MVVKVRQPIGADNSVDLLLGLSEYLRMEHHAQHETHQEGPSLGLCVKISRIGNVEVGNTVSVAADHWVNLVIVIGAMEDPTSVQYTSDVKNILFVDCL